MLQDCQAGERFEGMVLISEWKEIQFKQKPGTYLNLNCQDRSGVMSGKVWEVEPQYLTWLRSQDIYYIEGLVTEYRGTLSLTIEVLRPVPDDAVDLALLLPASPLSVQQLEERLENLVRQVTRPELSLLLRNLLNHEQTGRAFRQAPAAAKVHQAYLRGLWEHSLGVAELAAGIAGNYPEVDHDLLLTGALLHDLGKIVEYSYERGITFTTEGRLLGHIIMGIDLLSKEIELIPGFNSELRAKLLHIVTSHHGRYEWQSPKRPKLIEALIIHHADSLEADLWQFRQAKENHPNDEWSPYVPSMERYLYLK